MSAKPFVLNVQELQSPVWVKLRDHLNERLDYLRKQNDCVMTEQATASLRGQILQVKALLAIDKD